MSTRKTDNMLPAFQQYQLQFTGHIRNPVATSRPAGVLARRMRVYNEIVFNNLESAVSPCFPVSKAVLGIRKWRRLVRDFFANHQSKSPLFRQIPQEFLRYLQTAQNQPAFLYSLAHYEWIELAVSVMDVTVDMSTVNPDGDLLTGRPLLVPALQSLSYDYPVQRISPRFKPDQVLNDPVHLLVFRDSDDTVRFSELNSLTARLIDLLQTGTTSGRAALETIADETPHISRESIISFGHTVLQELKAQGVVLGTARE